MRPSAIVSGLLGVLLLAVSLVGLASARSTDVRSDTAGGVPVRLYSAGADRPAVIVAHGFSGSAQMMEPLAIGLQRAGFTVVTFDFPGHGANPEHLAFTGDVRNASWDLLTTPLAEVVDWAAVQPEVDRTRLTLLGHSMGAGAAVAYSAKDSRRDQRIRGTVALSLPTGEDVPPGKPSVPQDLLLMYGALEAPQFGEAAMNALGDAYPAADSGVTYGDAAEGTARRVEVVPNVEHIGILFSSTTLAASVAWLSAVVGIEPADTAMPPVLLYAVLAIIAGGLLLVPLSLIALGSPPQVPREAEPTPVRGRYALLIGAAAAVLAALGARLLAPVTDAVPLAVGGYLAAWFSCAGVVALGWWWWRVRRSRSGPGFTTRSVLGGSALALLAAGVIAVPGSMSWSAFSLVGDRLWVAALLLVAFSLYFAADELYLRRASASRRIGLMVLSRLVAVVVLLAAIPLLGAPGFLVLILPVLLLFLLILGCYAAIVTRRRDPYVAAVLVQSVPAAVLVATTFPLIG